MCGRYSVDKEKVDTKHRYAAKLADITFEKNFDARPSQQLPIFLPNTEKAVLATWSSPEKEPDGKPTLPFNVRQENLLFIPRFRALLPQNRCIIPIDGFFEWKEIEPEPEEQPFVPEAGLGLDMFGNPIRSQAETRRLKKVKPKKQKYRFTLKLKEPFGLAGLWRESLNPATGELTKYFSIITTHANAAVMPYHDRMPVILTPETEEIWLNSKMKENQLYNVLKPYESKLMVVKAIDDYESTLGNYVEPKLNSK